MRSVPEDVQKKADDLYWDRDKSHGGFGCAEEAYEFIAEWARKEALREAAELTVSMVDNEPDGYYGQACYEVASAIRALAEGGA